MLEDGKAQELRMRADSEGYGALTKKDLLYLASKSLYVGQNPNRQPGLVGLEAFLNCWCEVTIIAI